MKFVRDLLFTCVVVAAALPLAAKLGDRFPSEKKVIPDPFTGVPLTFLTTASAGESKIYPTHRQWTADSQWLVFRSGRVRGEAMAVHEESGVMVQVTEGAFAGCSASRSTR